MKTIVEKEAVLFLENQEELVSEEFISNVHNIYVNDYNRGNSKIPIVEGMLSIVGRYKDALTQIEETLESKYGFSPDAWQLIGTLTKEQYTNAIQLWVDKNKYTEKDFNEAFEVIFRESRRYFEIYVSSQIIDWLATVIIKNGYPIKLKLYKDLSENEKEEYLSKLDEGKGHIHRKSEIIRKYQEIESKYPKMNDSQIKKEVQDWYLDLTGKDIDEGTIRYYLKEK